MPALSRRITAAVSTGTLDTPDKHEHAARPRLTVELRDALHEIRPVGEVEIRDAARKRGAHHTIRVAIDLERPARVDHDIGRERRKLRVRVAVAVERRRDHLRLRRQCRAERLRLRERTPRNDERQARLIGEQPRKPPAERAVAAEDQDAQAHAMNRSANRGSGR